ncbi:hypothetical protein [Thermomonospora umbrina]|uniref:Uncharacterized protein n=1 Tax=Thermomonospora umbrina TaxID=111806 RepID=A0A3D9SLJ0_9ACTN|nr:hypothetical protein [Thermomonospora umbrina]REE94773.1 hypothetical protein DFJ69_0131 [Thermomonospora umbrina]
MVTRRGRFRYAVVVLVGLLSTCLMLTLGPPLSAGSEVAVPTGASVVRAVFPVPVEALTGAAQNACPENGPSQEEPGTGHARPRCESLGLRLVKMPDGGTASFLDAPRSWAIAPPRGFHCRPRCTERRPAGTRTLLLQVLRR